MKRAAETIGWDMRKAYDRLPLLKPGEFVATCPAFSPSPAQLTVGEIKSRHIGASPQLAAVTKVDAGEAANSLRIIEMVREHDRAERQAGRTQSRL